MTTHLLLTIKTRRLERKKQILDQQKLKIQSACHDCQQRTEEYEAFRAWRIAEETRLFEQCKIAVLNQQALENWQNQVAALRKQEAVKAKAMAEYQTQLEREREQHQEYRRHYQLAWHHVEKFHELNQHDLIAQQRRQELKEEQELEEFNTMQGISIL